MQFRVSNPITQLLTLPFLLFCSAFPVLSAVFHAEGSFTVQNYNQSGEARGSLMERSFAVKVDHCKWQIEVALASNDAFKVFVTQCDGLNIYDRVQFVPKQENTKSINDGVLNVYPGLVPAPMRSTFEQRIWLALCSSCFFSDNHDDLIPALWASPPIDPIQFRPNISMHWEPLSDSLMLPATCDMFDPGKVFRISNARPGPTAETTLSNIYEVARPAPFDSGFLRDSYQVISTNIVAGIPFPDEFVYRSYSAHSGGAIDTENPTYLVSEMHASVEELTVLSNATELAIPWFSEVQLTGATYVVDYRVNSKTNQSSIDYLLKDAQLPNAGGITVEQANSTVRAAIASKNRSWFDRYVWLFALACFATITVAALYRSRHMNSPDTE